MSLDLTVTFSFRPYDGPGVDSASSENECQEHFLGVKGGRCVRLTTSPLSSAECHGIWERKPPGTLWATPDLLRDTFTFALFNNLLLVKGKADPLQAWSGPEGSRKLRFLDFMTTAQDGGKLSALRTGRLNPQEKASEIPTSLADNQHN
jgi:hypothetical protein